MVLTLASLIFRPFQTLSDREISYFVFVSFEIIRSYGVERYHFSSIIDLAFTTPSFPRVSISGSK